MTALSAHSGQLERWLGKETLEHLSKSMKGWYGRPIGIGGVPGKVYVDKGGDFRGRIYGGLEVGVREIWEDIKTRGMRGIRAAGNPNQLNAGFTSLSDFIAAYSANAQRRSFPLSKIGPAGVINVTDSLWQSAGYPPPGAAGSAAPGGRAPDKTTTGGFPYVNAASGTMKFVAAYIAASQANNTLLLYDRIFDVAKTMNSTTTEAVSGVATRYQSTTTTNDDYCGDNFLFVEVQTVLPATAHNWTVCTYTNQAGSGATLPSLVGNSSAVVQRLDHPLNQWFAPLATGDSGIQTLTQMQASAAVATGAINFVIGHPIAWIPCAATAGVMAFTDGATTAFARIFDSACLTFLEICKPVAATSSYTGAFTAACS